VTDVVVAEVGMVPFVKPRESGSYVELGEAAVRAALADAGLGYRSVGQAYAGYVYGDSTCCPPTCGAAAAIVCTPEFARAHGVAGGVRIKARSLVTDTPSTFEAQAT
jgi:hypothetical protein